MSLQDTLIYGLKTLWVNAVQQYDKSAIEFAGPGVSVAVANNRNVVTIASTNTFAIGIAGPSVSIPAGGSVVAFADPDFLQPWTAAGLSMSGVAVNGGTVGQSISVQSFGETAGINHALWAYKPTAEDVGSAVYAAASYGYTMTPSATPGQYNQKIGIVWYADNEPLSDTTTILLNIQPPVIVPAA